MAVSTPPGSQTCAKRLPPPPKGLAVVFCGGAPNVDPGVAPNAGELPAPKRLEADEAALNAKLLPVAACRKRGRQKGGGGTDYRCLGSSAGALPPPAPPHEVHSHPKHQLLTPKAVLPKPDALAAPNAGVGVAPKAG